MKLLRMLVLTKNSGMISVVRIKEEGRLPNYKDKKRIKMYFFFDILILLL